MAGKKQHHVWKALQNGFSWKEHNDDQIWVFRKGENPEQTITKKFGVDKRFYGEPDSESDKNITDFESSIQGFIQETRQLKNGSVLDTESCASLLAHLEMRSQFMRNEMVRLAERAVKFIDDQVASRANFTRILSAYIKKHPEMLDAELEKSGADPSLWPALKVHFEKELPRVIRASHGEFSAAFEGVFRNALGSMAEIAKSSHNKTLTGNFSEVERTGFHRKLTFTLLEVPSMDLILPDTCVAFFMQSGCRPISSKVDKVESVVMPVSRNRAIIGRKDTTKNWDVPTIKRALASCSFEAFIAPENNKDFQALASRIGKNAQMVRESEVSKIFQVDRLLKDL
jgi:hypothetical protein